jgi:hypothetical protein
MSMHEIEDLVDDSIGMLDTRRPADDDRVRDWIAVLYRFQSRFDCSFTQFRAMDILLRRRYTYRFPLDQHPDYARRREYFDSLDDFTALRADEESSSAGDPSDEDDVDDGSDWLEDGYVQPPHLYCDAGTALWRRMVDAGHLSGPDATPPRRAALIAVVAAVAAIAEADGDREAIAMWYNFGPGLLLEDDDSQPYTVEQVRSIDAVRELREIVERTDALSVELAYDYRPTAEAVAADPLDSWWWGQIASTPRP